MDLVVISRTNRQFVTFDRCLPIFQNEHFFPFTNNELVKTFLNVFV